MEEAVDAATGHDRWKAFTLEQVEERFRAACAASRWDLPQPHLLIPLMLRLVSWDDTIRLLLEHPRPYMIHQMLQWLSPPEVCGATKEVTERGKARLRDFVDGQDHAGTHQVAAALQFLNYPEGVARFFKACTNKRVARDMGGPLLVQVSDANVAYTAAKKLGIALPAHRIL